MVKPVKFSLSKHLSQIITVLSLNLRRSDAVGHCSLFSVTPTDTNLVLELLVGKYQPNSENSSLEMYYAVYSALGAEFHRQGREVGN